MTTNQQSTSDTAAIVAEGLAKTWPGGVEAVRGLDLEVGHGEVFGLLGPNGAGKSTTIGMLTTTVVPTAGRARIGGHDVTDEPIAARARSAVVFQDAVVDRGLSGRRNLTIHGRLWGVPRAAMAERVEGLTRDFGLRDLLDRPVATLSGGQRRRLELARSLLSDPAVLFLDEPTVGLDPRIRFELLDLIAGLRSRTGMTVVLTTHYLDEAERLCDRVAIMHEGSVVAVGAPAALLADLGSEVLELRVAHQPERAISALRTAGVAGGDAFAVGSTVTIPLHGRPVADALTVATTAGIVPVATSVRPPTLDDVYLRLTGDRLAA